MGMYRVTVSDQTDDEGDEISYVQTAGNIMLALLAAHTRFHDMVQAKKITIVEEQA